MGKSFYSYTERLVIDLQKKSHLLLEEDRGKAKSLLSWYVRNGEFTKSQRFLIRCMLRRVSRSFKARAPGRADSVKYWLYGISDGTYVKLGYSSNIKERIASLQTSSPNELVEVWRFYVGRSEREAKRNEAALHRACRKHSKRGEWFSADCMVTVGRFSLLTPINKEASP